MRAIEFVTSRPIDALTRLFFGVLVGLVAIYLSSWLFGEVALRQTPGAPYNIEPDIWLMVVISSMTGTLVGSTIAAIYRRNPVCVAGIAAMVHLVVGVLMRGSDIAIPLVQAAAIVAGTLLMERLLAISSPRVKALARGLGVAIASVTAISFSLLWFGPYRSKNVALDFCNSVSVGDGIQNVLEKAKAGGMTHRHFDGHPSHEFLVAGAFGTYSACEVSFGNDRVSQKLVNNYSTDELP